ncbi:Ku protein [Paracoccus litorisediminis]|uniref:Ku protein n=1 Tax=Paracoccus litorisediminis TaxID=2006130 RepID=UPI00373356D4
MAPRLYEELDSIALHSARTIDIDMFVPAGSIGWIWYDKPHDLIPDDRIGAEAFSVIREAMAKSDMVGISRLVLYRRERAVLLVPRGKGIVLWTLRYGDEVRLEGDYFGGLDTSYGDPAALRLVTRLIKDRTRPWSPEMAHDPVQDRLMDIIAAKKKGRSKPKTAKAPAEKFGKGNCGATQRISSPRPLRRQWSVSFGPCSGSEAVTGLIAANKGK